MYSTRHNALMWTWAESNRRPTHFHFNCAEVRIGALRRSSVRHRTDLLLLPCVVFPTVHHLRDMVGPRPSRTAIPPIFQFLLGTLKVPSSIVPTLFVAHIFEVIFDQSRKQPILFLLPHPFPQTLCGTRCRCAAWALPTTRADTLCSYSTVEGFSRHDVLL